MSDFLEVRAWHEHGPFTFIDTETTGFSAVHHRIVEIAALRVEVDGSRSEFYSLINPRCKIPTIVQRIHHIDDLKVQKAPAFHEVAYDLLAFVEGTTLVAHNARFDLAFIQESLARSGVPLFKGKTLDTLTFFRNTYPQLKSHKLQDIRNFLKIGTEKERAHSAMGDVIVLMESFAKTLELMMQPNTK